MKNILKSVFLLFLCNNVFGQTKNQINVTATYMGVFYVGLDNIITINSNDGKNHDYIVKLSSCSNCSFESNLDTVEYKGSKIENLGNGRYNLLFSVRSGHAYLSISEKINGEIKEVGSWIYRVRAVPRPVLDLSKAYLAEGSCDVDELKKLTKLKVKLDDFYRTDLEFKVVSYKFMALGRKTNGPKMVTSNSGSLEPIKSLISMLVPGDYIHFSDIRVVGPSNKALLLDNFGSQIGLKSTLSRSLEQQIYSDSINNIQSELYKYYSRNTKLSKESLLKNLVEYYQYGSFSDENPYFKKNLVKFELVNGKMERFAFDESEELRKKNGLVFKDTVVFLVLNSNVDPNNWGDFNPEDYHDSSAIRISSLKLNRVYFDKFTNNISKIKEWYLLAEYGKRTIAIPVSEFSKERVIFPQIVSNYLEYLMNIDTRKYEKNRIFFSQKFGIDSISKGRMNFFEDAAEFHLQRMYFKLITGSADRFENVCMGYDRDETYLKTWTQLLNNIYSKSPKNYSPSWYSSDSILNYSISSIPHDTFVKQRNDIVSFGNGITNNDVIYNYIPLQRINGFDVVSKINSDGTASSYLMVQINNEIMNMSIPYNYYINISNVYNLMDETEKIMISDIYKFGYSNLEVIRKKD